jgi:RNA polymerase-binding protein DksA
MPGASPKKAPTKRATPAKSKATGKAKTAARPVKKAAKTTAKSASKTAAKAAKAKKPAKAAKKTATKAKSTPKAAPAKSAAKPAKSTPPPAKAPPARPSLTAGPPRAKAGKGGKKTVICELSGFEVTPSVPGLSPKTLERLREKLTEEKQRLQNQAEELAAEAEQLAVEREAGDTQFDEESGEGDTVNVERERDLLLSATARQVVEEIDEALARMKKGTYGLCKYAGRKLPLERLEAIPWANVCVDCKARAERRR